MIALTPVAHIPAPSIDWFAIAPEIAMFSAALVIVLLRSLVRHHPRVHEASLIIAIGGVVTSAIFTAVQWAFVQNNGPYQALITSHTIPVGNNVHIAYGMVAVDGFAVFAKTVVLLATLLALLLSSSYLKREHLEGPEYFALLLCSATGMMLMTSANDLVTVFLVTRDPFDRPLRARCVRPPAHDVAGGRAQVLPARLVLLGGIPLRRGARLRRHGHDEPHRHRGVPVAHDPPPRRRAAARHRVPHRRPRLQGRSRALPHVDPRRVRRVTHAGDGVHGVGDEGGGLRGDSPRVRGRVLALQRRLAADRVRARRRVVARREHRGDRPDRREAHARVLVDQSRGLHPDRGAGRDREGHERRVVLRVDVRGDDDRRVRGRGRGRDPGRQSARARRLPRPRRAASRCLQACSRCSCSRRPGCRSRVGSWRSFRCSAPRSTSASTCSR